MCFIKIYLFENSSDLLDTLDKLSNIGFAIATFFLSIWIFIHTVIRDKNKEKKAQKLDFLKSLLLETNSIHFFNFYDNILNFVASNKNQSLSDDDKATFVELLIEEHRNFRIKFYDLVLPFNQEVYNIIKNKTDGLIDDFTNKIFDNTINYFHESNISQLEQCLLNTRSETLKTILNIK